MLKDDAAKINNKRPMIPVYSPNQRQEVFLKLSEIFLDIEMLIKNVTNEWIEVVKRNMIKYLMFLLPIHVPTQGQ